MRSTMRKLGIVAVAALSLAGATLATLGPAEARPWGDHRGHHWHGGGWGLAAPAVIGGLALGALAAAPYAYGRPRYVAYEDDYVECYVKRRVRYTPHGPVVRHVRVCY
jgi:hypothetical protein